jgi:hypothetical protein
MISTNAAAMRRRSLFLFLDGKTFDWNQSISASQVTRGFSGTAKFAERVNYVLEDMRVFTDIRWQARQTVDEDFNLKTICLPAQLHLLKRVADTRVGKG